MKKKIKRTFLFLLPALFFFVLAVILFRPYFTKGLVPVPADILLGHYYPWKDEVWQNRIAGYPIKNFILYDGIRQTLPWRLLAIEQIKSGRLPLWNPYNFSGTPLLGNLQTAAFYPLNFLFFAISPLNAWTIYLLLQPLLASVFAYFFLKSINQSKSASTLGGVCYGFALIMMNHLEFGIDGHTALWLPLALGAINKIQESPKKKWGLVFSLAVLMSILGGYPPPLIYNLTVIFFYILFKIRPFFSKKLIMVVIFGLLALGLTAPQTFPAFELATKVVRGNDFGISGGNYFLPLENLATLIAPDYFGHPSTGNYFSSFYHTDNPSIGIIGLLFVLFGLLTIFNKKETKFWTIFSLFPLLLMTNTPLGRLIGNSGISFLSFVTPLRMSWVIIFSFSVLAAIGFDFFINLIKQREKKNFLLIIIPFIVITEGLICLWISTIVLLQGQNSLIAQKNLILPTAFLLIAYFLLLISVVLFKKCKTILFLFVLLSSLELLRQGIKYNPFISKELIFPKIEILSDISNDGMFRTIVTSQEMLPANSNIPYRISMIDGYAPMYDGRYGQMVQIANSKYPINEVKNYSRIVFQTETNSPVIDLFGVKYVLSFEELKSKKFKLINKKGKTKVYENLDVFPKASIYYNYSIENSDVNIINKMLTSDLKNMLVLEKLPENVNNNVVSDKGIAGVVKYEEDQIIVKTISKFPGLLLINDSYDSGWQATIDGNKSEIIRADYNLKAIEIPEGSHEVKLYYFPDSLKAGIVVFFGTLLFSLIMLIAVNKTRLNFLSNNEQ